MTVYTDDFTAKKESAVALGFFDGVHMGHRRVNEAATEFARKYELLSGVFTFSFDEEKPATKEAKLIDSFAVKERQFMQMGLDYVYCPKFSDIAELTPGEFVSEILVKRCRAKMVSCGKDFRFGKDAEGDTELLIKLCADLGIIVKVQKSVKDWGGKVSSRRIRDLIERGKMEEARKLLGRSYRFEFPVVEGKHLGRKLGIPTINQVYPAQYVTPKAGVYVSKVKIDGKMYPSVSNIGINPTFGDNFRAETHIIGYSGDLYGKTVQVRLYEYIRPEVKFDSVEKLKEQIEKDIDYVMDYDFT